MDWWTPGIGAFQQVLRLSWSLRLAGIRIWGFRLDSKLGGCVHLHVFGVGSI